MSQRIQFDPGKQVTLYVKGDAVKGAFVMETEWGIVLSSVCPNGDPAVLYVRSEAIDWIQTDPSALKEIEEAS